MFRAIFAIECENRAASAIKVSPDKKTVDLRNVATGEVTTESYDKLVLSPGAPSIRPPLPGIDLPGIFEVRTVPDAKAIREWIEKGSLFLAGMHRYSGFQTRAAEDARGGGRRRLHRPGDGGEPRPSRLRRDARRDGRPDPGAARPGDGAHRRGLLERHGMRLALNDGVAGFEQGEDGTLKVLTKSGKTYPGRRRDPRARRASGYHAGQGGGTRDRRARRHPRRRPDAHEQPGHLRRRRCDRGQGLRDRRVEPHRARRPGEPAGPHRGRRDRRARLALPRHPGHLDHRVLRRRRGLDRRQREDAEARSATRTTRRSTSTRTRTRATTRARSRSR